MSVTRTVIIADAAGHLKTKWSGPRVSKTVAVGREIISTRKKTARAVALLLLCYKINYCISRCLSAFQKIQLMNKLCDNFHYK